MSFYCAFKLQVCFRFHVIVGLYSILGTVTFSTTLSRMTANGMAAWRSGGIPALPFKSALPAAVVPPLAAKLPPRWLQCARASSRECRIEKEYKTTMLWKKQRNYNSKMFLNVSKSMTLIDGK